MAKVAAKTIELDEQFAQRIKAEAMSGCNEGDHARADELLCEILRLLGFDRTVDAWERVGKWYA